MVLPAWSRPLLGVAFMVLPVGLGACGASSEASAAPDRSEVAVTTGGSPAPADPGSTVTGDATTPASSASAPEEPGTTEPPGTTTTTELPLPPESPPVAPGDNRVYILGDSVLAGAKVEIPVAMKGWKPTVDAVESRFVTNGIAVLDAKRTAIDKDRTTTWEDEKAAAEAAGQPVPEEPVKVTLVEAVGRVVVVNLCTNYEATGAFATLIPRYMETLKAMDRVVWMTCSEWSKGQTEANAAIRDAAPKYKNVVVADWARYSDKPGYTYQDGIHLDGPGRKAVAELLALAIGPAPKAK